jgi:hypothetical protein
MRSWKTAGTRMSLLTKSRITTRSLGDKENTLHYLDQADAIHDVALTDIKTERNFEPLGADPRYALLRRMGLAH